MKSNNSILQEHCKNYYLPLMYLGVFYISAMIIADLITYKLFPVFGYPVSMSLIIFPLTYSIGDITAEAYNRSIAVRLVLITIAADFFTDTFLSMVSHAPSPISMAGLSHDFSMVFAPLQQVFWGNLIGLSLGSLLNVTLMSKLKIAYKSKYFILRSIFSTFCGEIVYTVIAYIVWFFNKSSFEGIAYMIIISMVFKVIFAGFTAIPSYYIARYISRKGEKIKILMRHIK